jgi:hypothetical protein
MSKTTWFCQKNTRNFYVSRYGRLNKKIGNSMAKIAVQFNNISMAKIAIHMSKIAGKRPAKS